MAALGITVLKHNVPWGPFTRTQIDDGLARGDFTVKSLAHAPGLSEWLPLADVLDYVARSEGPPLPPVPAPRQLPPVPESPASNVPPLRPPISAPATPRAPSPPTLPAAVPKPEARPEAKSFVDLPPASFFRRGVAFGIDCTILFGPVLVLYLLGALAIEIPGAWHHINHQSRMEEWELLNLNTQRLLWLVATGFAWLYGAGLECSPSQATIGKRWMGLKVTDACGERMGFLRSSARFGAKYLSALPCFLGFILALFSSRGLAWHDRLARTRVLRA